MFATWILDHCHLCLPFSEYRSICIEQNECDEKTKQKMGKKRVQLMSAVASIAIYYTISIPLMNISKHIKIHIDARRMLYHYYAWAWYS